MQTAFKLQAPVTWQAPWRAYCANLPPPRIGLVWSGNPAHRNDHNRSLKPAQVAPLFQHLGPHLVSLQKGSAASALPAGLCDAASHLDDFAALAGLIETLDLVISVDTAPAHLAGMLGKPVWILLPFLPDWRWLLGREDSPWYPTARLFRQEKPSSWPQVVARVMAEAERLIAGDQTVLTPQPWPKPALRQHPQAIAL
jgi:hypothetical protein